eukprot:11172086-Lingulodinium_polyedra.AAC.1
MVQCRKRISRRLAAMRFAMITSRRPSVTAQSRSGTRAVARRRRSVAPSAEWSSLAGATSIVGWAADTHYTSAAGHA